MSDIKRVIVNGKRHYQIDGVEQKLPSVTSILSGTRDMKFLFEWRKRVGTAEANRISKLSAGRGTVMHKLIELYLETPSDMPYDERIAETMKCAKIDEEILEVNEKKAKDEKARITKEFDSREAPSAIIETAKEIDRAKKAFDLVLNLS